jgi:hypothetical protein
MEKHKLCTEKIVKKTLKEFEKRKLKQADDKIITNRKQALAIALSKADDECKYTKTEYKDLKEKVDAFFNEPIINKIPLTNVIETRQLIEYYYSKKDYKKCIKYESMIFHYIILAGAKGIEITENVWKELKAIKKLEYKRY